MTSAQPHRRKVFGLLGLTIDADTRDEVLTKIASAAQTGDRLFISTVNLNYLVLSQSDLAFRDTVRASDLCTADGAPVLWMSRLFGVRVPGRVAGSDLFDLLCRRAIMSRKLKVALFGGPEGLAETASHKINSTSGVQCVAAIYPGFGDISDMSSDEVIGRVNSSQADFLFVSLGAAKGQEWLSRNAQRLKPPVRVHLGATLKFWAGSVSRSPRVLQIVGLEWLWRIKEEPNLFWRYWNDGRDLLYLLCSRVLPLAFELWWNRYRFRGRGLKVELVDKGVMMLSGYAGAGNLDGVFQAIELNDTGQDVRIDLSGVDAVDAQFMGMMCVLNMRLSRRGTSVKLFNAKAGVRRCFTRNGFGDLLDQGPMV